MKNRRTAVASAAGLLAITAVTSGAIAASPNGAVAAATRPAGCDRALDILLTNDDGYAAPGINAVYEALSQAGHHVTMVAPLTNQTGRGGALAYGGTLAVTHPVAGDPSVYAVAGTPADSVGFGLGVVFADAAPDLVVSGSNAGTNLSRTINHSGTVGAAVTAVDRGVPAIAVSTAHPFEFDPTWNGGSAENYPDTARFVVSLVAALRQRADNCRSLLPRKVGLNVNYPSVAFKGARVTALAEHESIPTSYAEVSEGTYKVSYSLSPMQDAASDSDPRSAVDYEAVARGYASITPLDGSLGLEQTDRSSQAYVERVVRSLD